MSVDKHKSLVKALIQKTDAGKLEWKPTASSNEFQVSFTNSSLIITDQTRGETRDILMLILNELGEVVERFTDVELDATEPRTLSMDPTWFNRMDALLNSARRSALGSDRILNNILTELKGGD